MKKAKLLLAAAALTLASTAAADQVGFFLVGAQYQQDNGLRYGLGLPVVSLFRGGGLALSGDVSYLRPFQGGTDSIKPYYGFGLGLGVVFASGATGLSIYPNVLAGLNFNTGTAWTPFAEASVGPNIVAVAAGGASAAGVGLGFGLRLGANYRLN